MSAYPNNPTDDSTAGILSIFSNLTPLNYLLFLTCSLILFLGYLILPMGIRAQYCGAGRRRYRRQGAIRKRVQQHHRQQQQQQKQNSLSPEDILGNIYAYSHSFSPQEQVVSQLFGGGTTAPSSDQKHSDIISSQASAFDSVWNGVDESHGSEMSYDQQQQQQQQLALPQIVREMLEQPPGIKFVAHGTKCRPRPVWITLHCDINSQSTTPLDYQNCLTWRAELKSHKSPSSAMSASPGPKMGNLRKVQLSEVLGIEKGKRTTALRRVQTAKGVNENECFSLLTKTGTLDLECTGLEIVDTAGTSSHCLSPEEVRAAFITCLAMAMVSKGLRLNGLQPSNNNAPSSQLQSQLNGLNNNNSSGASYRMAQLDECTLFSSLINEARSMSTVSS